MVDVTRADIAMHMGNVRNMIKPSSWSSYAASTIPSFVLASLTLLAAILLAHLISWTMQEYQKMQDERRPSFPFLNLPRELRDMVYEHLIEGPI
jgi:hypothetical protein